MRKYHDYAYATVEDPRMCVYVTIVVVNNAHKGDIRRH